MRTEAPGFGSGAASPIRSPKTGELVARRLRRMIVDGELSDGEFLPQEAALMEQFAVSRPTLREAVRVLESEGLVELRRGSRTGARVTVPGPEVVARAAALQLQLQGATLADVLLARAAVEPVAARLVAQSRDRGKIAVLEEALEAERERADEPEAFAVGAVDFHRRLVEQSGSATLAVMAGMLNVIIERQLRTAFVRKTVADPVTARKQRRGALKAYAHLIDLLRSGSADEAEAYWRKHLDAVAALMEEEQAERPLDILE
jgi:DNA-binding FadR family transcriptional regulator